jgi:hypothetical protein
MKRLLLTAVSLAALGSAPALACPMMQQAAATTTTTAQAAPSSGGMMCGRPTAIQAQAQPSTPQPDQQAQGGCSCCRNMAMMQTPQGGQSPSMPGMGNMPGMQQPTPSPTPAPEQPKP